MTTVFTRILRGEIPGTFVWRDDVCAAFLSINPINHGHTLVVPVAEVDHWLDLPGDTVAHLMEVSRVIGLAQQAAFSPARVGLMIAGFEVPHVHVHVIPMEGMQHISFASAAASVSRQELDAAAVALRAALRAAGRAEVPAD